MIELIFNSESVSMQMVAKSVSVKLRALGSTIPRAFAFDKGLPNINAAGSAGSFAESFRLV